MPECQEQTPSSLLDGESDWKLTAHARRPSRQSPSPSSKLEGVATLRSCRCLVAVNLAHHRASSKGSKPSDVTDHGDNKIITYRQPEKPLSIPSFPQPSDAVLSLHVVVVEIRVLLGLAAEDPSHQPKVPDQYRSPNVSNLRQEVTMWALVIVLNRLVPAIQRDNVDVGLVSRYTPGAAVNSPTRPG